MATLYNTRISDTYVGLIKTIDNAAISATLKELSDGSGNGTGLSLNNAGDFKVNAILEFGSLKDTGENIIISKFVDAADGIGNNNNDTSIPTTKAIIDYVAGQITAEDLDFRGDDSTVLGDVDLNSQAFIILGTANEIETSVTSAGGNTLQIGIPSNPVLTGIVTATTFSGDLNGTINTATTAVTQSAGDNSTKVATTAYVDTLDAASDLDFSGDSGSGDVTLNTQTFAITGTTNQVVTSASNETLNISLPSTVHRNLQGNVTGNLTGNVTGNVAGDLTGNVTASSVLANGVTATTQASSDNSTKVATTAYVKGLDNASDLDITDGTTSGDVNLNTQSLSILGTSSQVVSTVSNQSVTLSLPSSINVNSASATILQNARDISLTGEASATISSFNGSANVSGAVTLDNDSVTGKVLTGLASPTATNILASDSILEAFGKTQSQLNTLAGGLRFMGTWNATSNTPTLASGGGESASGTTTGTTANKLVDSSGAFTSAVDGDKVVNQASGATATVTNVDSSTVLSLSADIMVSGQEYTIDNSPYITQGHYFVVSVGGTSSLNGLSNWAVGDWVIAGAGNVWEKLDHTQVDGTGTVGNITKWSSTNVIADSIMAESGSTITATGSIAATQLLSSGGNFAVNTDKFTVNATTGNVAVGGTVNSGTITSTGNVNCVSLVATSAILDNVVAKTTNGNIVFKKNSGATIASFNNDLSSTFQGSVTSNAVPAFIVGTVGAVGNTANDVNIYSTTAGHNGLRMHAAGILPTDNTGTIIDNDADLGDVSYRFKDLYLGGSIISSGAAGFTGDITISKIYPKLILNDTQGVQRNFSVGVDNEDFTVRNETSSSNSITITGSTNTVFFAGNVGIKDTASFALDVNIENSRARFKAATGDAGIELSAIQGHDWLIESKSDDSFSIYDEDEAKERLNISNTGTAKFNGMLDIGQSRSTYVNNAEDDTATAHIFTTDAQVGDFAQLAGSLVLQARVNDAIYRDIIMAGGLGTAADPVVPILTVKGEGIVQVDGSLTVNGDSTFANMITINIDDISTGENRGVRIINTNGVDQQWNITAGVTGQENDSFCIRNSTDNQNSLVINRSGLANFASGANFVSQVKINNSSSALGKLSVKSSSGASTFYNNIQCIPSDATTGGLFIGSNVTNDAIMVTGAYYKNAGKYTPTATSASIINMYGGNVRFFGDTGLTIGTEYTPTQRMNITSNGFVQVGNTDTNGSFGASNTVLSVKGKTSGGEGILQVSGLGNTASDNVGRVSFHSYNEANPLAEIRAVRGNSDTVGRIETYTSNVLRDRLDENGAYEFQGAEAGVGGIRFQGSGTCNGYSGSFASFYVMDVMRDQGSGKSMNVQGTIDIANGYGIGFGASAGSGASSTLLDDYEEGGWTPVASDFSGNNATIDATNSVGVYTKIGDLVYWRCTIQMSSKGSMVATDTFRIQGFPFTSISIAGNWYRPSSAIIKQVDFDGFVNFSWVSNSTYGYLFDSRTGAAGTTIPVSDISDNSAMSFSGVSKVQ